MLENLKIPHITKGTLTSRLGTLIFVKSTTLLKGSNSTLKCANCGSLSQDESPKCGVCGSRQVYPQEQLPLNLVKQAPFRRRGRARAILVLIIGIVAVVEGAILAFLPIAPTLTVLGFFIMMVGAVILLMATGVFSGTPYRSRLLNRAERELKRRERKKYAD